MIKVIKRPIELPFEEGKTYKTKFATGENFLLKEIVWGTSKVNGEVVKNIIKFKGIYENNPELGICPLNPDRLIPLTNGFTEHEACSKCGEPIK